MPLRLPIALLAFATSFHAQDRYPKPHQLILEALELSRNIPVLPDRGEPHSWAGRLLSQAGYLDDAERAFRRFETPGSWPPFHLWSAWVVYGKPERMEQLLRSRTNPNHKAPLLAAYAFLLWRLQKPSEALAKYNEAKALAQRMTDTKSRANTLARISQGLEYVNESPPNPISSKPRAYFQPIKSDPAAPSFPITAGGFLEIPLARREAQAAADEKVIRDLYAGVVAGDPAAMVRITNASATPFQKAMALASLQHLLNQSGRAELSHQYASAIPHSDAPSSLARAEALASAARLQAQTGAANLARVTFLESVEQANAVQSLPLGRITVLNAISASQYRAGFSEDSAKTHRVALRHAASLPLRPTPIPGRPRPAQPLNVHYQDEAFNLLLKTAVQIRDKGRADLILSTLGKSNQHGASMLVDAWLDVDDEDKAIAAARAIPDVKDRISSLLSLASTLLNRAGAPAL